MPGKIVVQTPEEKKEKEDLAHYAAMVAAWFNTSLEHEKSLLTLSSAGIALLISITLKGDLKPLLALVFYGVALWSFVVCLIAVLWIYRQNRPHLEAIVASRATTSWSSSPGELHLQALTQRYVNLSIHTAPIVQPLPVG